MEQCRSGMSRTFLTKGLDRHKYLYPIAYASNSSLFERALIEVEDHVSPNVMFTETGGVLWYFSF